MGSNKRGGPRTAGKEEILAESKCRRGVFMNVRQTVGFETRREVAVEDEKQRCLRKQTQINQGKATESEPRCGERAHADPRGWSGRCGCVAEVLARVERWRPRIDDGAVVSQRWDA